MTNLSRPIYFCSECKKVVHQLENLLFIEENSQKGFCSETCIEDFYFPLIKFFEVKEQSLRQKFNILDETDCQNIDGEDIEKTINSPDEIYKLSNSLNDHFYFIIKKFETYSIIIVATMYLKEVSFIFLTCKTNSFKLINEFRSGELIIEHSTSPKREEFEMLSEHEINEASNEDEDIDDKDLVFLQFLESKKSKILADILMKRKDSDIPFEDFTEYESYFQDSLDRPDEVFEYKDNEGDILFFYIKSFSSNVEKLVNIYYIVICIKNKNETNNEIIVYPILGLPTKDLDLCQEFRCGKRVSGPLQN